MPGYRDVVGSLPDEDGIKSELPGRGGGWVSLGGELARLALPAGPAGMGRADDVAGFGLGEPPEVEPWAFEFDAVGPSVCAVFPIHALLVPACMEAGRTGVAECLDATGVGPLPPIPGICSLPPS